jgi:hypothetical protein
MSEVSPKKHPLIRTPPDNGDGYDRRKRWFTAGVLLLLVSVALVISLFITPLERHLFNGGTWFGIVTGLQVASVIALGTAGTKRDTLGVTARSFAVVSVILALGLTFVFVAILSLSGLR